MHGSWLYQDTVYILYNIYSHFLQPPLSHTHPLVGTPDPTVLPDKFLTSAKCGDVLQPQPSATLLWPQSEQPPEHWPSYWVKVQELSYEPIRLRQRTECQSHCGTEIQDRYTEANAAIFQSAPIQKACNQCCHSDGPYFYCFYVLYWVSE